MIIECGIIDKLLQLAVTDALEV